MKIWTSTSGSKARRSRGNWLWLLLLLTLPAPGDEAPDQELLELLEFLGEWQDDSGYWIDPLQLSDAGDDTSAPAPKEQEND